MNNFPSHPPTDHFRKLSKTLLKRHATGDPNAIARAAAVFADLGSNAGDFTLMRAQHVIAVEHGFESWAKLNAAPAQAQREAIARLRPSSSHATPQAPRWDHEPTEACFSSVPLDLTIDMLNGNWDRWAIVFESLTKFGAKRGLHRPLSEPEVPTSDPVKAAYADAWWRIQRSQPGHRISERPEQRLNMAAVDLLVYDRTLGEIAHHLFQEERLRGQAALDGLSEAARMRLDLMLTHADVRSAVVFTAATRSIWPPQETRRVGPSPVRSDVFDDPAGESIVVQGFAAEVDRAGRSVVEGRFRRARAAWGPVR